MIISMRPLYAVYIADIRSIDGVYIEIIRCLLQLPYLLLSN